MEIVRSIAVSTLAFVLVACGSGGSSDAPGGSTTGTDPVVGKTCTSDAECGAGYACQPSSSEPSSGPGCTPNRACTDFECIGICQATGQIDLETGAPTAECMADCKANAKCCDGGGGGGGGGGGTQGTCAKVSGPTPSEDAGPTSTPIDWAGTWNAAVAYDVACDTGFGNMKTAHQEHTVAVDVAGSSGSLTATPATPTSGWNPMKGTGNDGGATLSGEFPFRDHAGDTVGSKDNAVTLKLGSVASAKDVSGTIEGKGVNRFGFKCTLSNGTVHFTR